MNGVKSTRYRKYSMFNLHMYTLLYILYIHFCIHKFILYKLIAIELLYNVRHVRLVFNLLGCDYM